MQTLSKLSFSVLVAMSLTACGGSSGGGSNNSGNNSGAASTPASTPTPTTTAKYCGATGTGAVYYVTNTDISQCDYKTPEVKAKIEKLYNEWQAALSAFLSGRSEASKNKLTTTKAAFDNAIKAEIAAGNMYDKAGATAATTTTATAEINAAEQFEFRTDAAKKLIIGIKTTDASGAETTEGANLQGTYDSSKANYLLTKEKINDTSVVTLSHPELADLAIAATRLGMESAEYNLRAELKKLIARGEVVAKTDEASQKALAYVNAVDTLEYDFAGVSTDINDYNVSDATVKATLEAASKRHNDYLRIFLGSSGRGQTNADGQKEVITFATGATNFLTGTARAGMVEASSLAVQAYAEALKAGKITKKDILADTPLKLANRISDVANVAGTYQVNFGKCLGAAGRYGAAAIDCKSFVTGAMQITFDSAGAITSATLVDASLYTVNNSGVQIETPITGAISFTGAKLVKNTNIYAPENTFTLSYTGLTGLPAFASNASSVDLAFAQVGSTKYMATISAPIRGYAEKGESDSIDLSNKLDITFAGQTGVINSSAPTTVASGATYVGMGGSSAISNRRIGNRPISNVTDFANSQTPGFTTASYTPTLGLNASGQGTVTVVNKYAQIFKTTASGRGGVSTSYANFWLSSPDNSFYAGNDASGSIVLVKK